MMQNKTKTYECYPWWSVLVDNLISYSLYVVGAYLLYLIWPWLVLPLVFLLIYIDRSIYKEGCVHCCYYGKGCHSGKGWIAKKLFKRGDPNVFLERTVTFKDFLPQFAINIIVLIAGVYLLIAQGFNWAILALTLWPVVAFNLNQVTFGLLACPHCQQGQIGCPVYEMFKPKGDK